MQSNLTPGKPQLLTLKQFADKNPWPKETTLRNLFYKRKSNGLAKAFMKVSKRIIVDEEAFFRIIREKSGANQA